MLQNQTDFLNALNKLTEGNTSDDVLDILEYASKIDTSGTDRIAELEAKVSTLETEKTNLDNTWREKYRNAFFNPPNDVDRPAPESNQNDGADYQATKIQIKDLFKPIQ